MAGSEAPEHLDQVACEAAGYLWRNKKVSFDNIFSSILVLVEVASLEMWPTIMYRVVDSTAPGLAPQTNNMREASVYFVCFIVVGSFFIIGLFVGVVVDEYRKQHQRYTVSNNLSLSQRQYLLAYKEMVHNDRGTACGLAAVHTQGRGRGVGVVLVMATAAW